MFDIKASSNFYGISVVLSAEEFDGYMYMLDMACEKYEEISQEKLDACLTVIRVLKNCSFFDIEKRQVHVEIAYVDLSTLAQILYDVAMEGCQPKSDCSFDKCIASPTAQLWKDKRKKK